MQQAQFYREGYFAYFDGVKYANNPHTIPYRRKEWAEGWRRAQVETNTSVE